MASWTTYRGMNVPDVSTGDAGDYLTDNFEELANRAAQANFAATTNPGADDDIGAGYYPGSHWLNTTTDTMFICVDNTATAAVWQEIGSGSGDGTVTSVGLSLPGIFSVSGSPVTTSGTLAGSLANQSANELFAGPSTGSPAAPTFRSLVTADLPDDGVTDAKLRNSAALSVIGRASNSTGDPADIAASNDGEVLRRSGTSLGFGTIATAGIADDQVTFAKMQNISSQRLIGRQAASSGDPTEITVAAGTGITVDWSTTDTITLSSTGGTVTSVGLALPAIFSVSGSPVTSSGTLTGSLANQSANQVFAGPSTGSAAAPTFRSFVTADLPDDGVTDVKLRNSTALSVIGRASNSTGDPADIAAANDGEVLRRSGTSLGFGTIATAGIADNAVTYAKIQNISATDKILGRASSGAGDVEEIDCTPAARSILDDSTTGAMLATVIQPRRNAIINGDMLVAQRGTSFSAASGYTIDRWQFGANGGAIATVSQSTDVPSFANAGRLIPYSLRAEVTTADTSIGAGDFAFFRQVIEGNVWRQFALRPLTISFWVRSTTTGTNCVSFINGSGDRSLVLEYMINASNTWEFKSLSVPPPEDGTWYYDTRAGVYLDFTFAAGSNWHASTAGFWVSEHSGSGCLATSSQVNGVNDLANIFAIASVQLELGSGFSGFDIRPYAEELRDCQRYCQVIGGEAGYQRIGIGQAIATTNAIVFAQLMVPMRAAPSISLSDPSHFALLANNGSILNSITINTDTSTTLSYTFNVSRSSGLTAGDCTQLVCNNTFSARLTFSAEL